MKILNVISSTNPAHGGPMEWVRQYGTTAQNMGHHVDVVSMDPPNAPWLNSFPLHTFALGSGIKDFYNARLLPWLINNAENYDHIIVHGLWRYPSLATRRAMKKIGKPYFVYTHGMLGPWFKKNFPLKHFCKWLYWPWTDYKVLRDAQAILFTCEQEKELAPQSFWLYKGNEVVAPLGIARPEININKCRKQFLSVYPELENKHLFLFLGRIHEVKGCDLLIKAFAGYACNFQDTHLILAGPDPTGIQHKLHSLAEKSGVENRITWTGMLDDEAKWGAIEASNVLILPSHHENFSFTVVEAMAVGKPVLITDQVGIWREVARYNAGLVAPDTLAGVEQLLGTWSKLSKVTKRQISENAKRCYAEQFEIKHATRHLINILSNRQTN